MHREARAAIVLDGVGRTKRIGRHRGILRPRVPRGGCRKVRTTKWPGPTRWPSPLCRIRAPHSSGALPFGEAALPRSSAGLRGSTAGRLCSSASPQTGSALPADQHCPPRDRALPSPQTSSALSRGQLCSLRRTALLSPQNSSASPRVSTASAQSAVPRRARGCARLLPRRSPRELPILVYRSRTDLRTRSVCLSRAQDRMQAAP